MSETFNITVNYINWGVENRRLCNITKIHILQFHWTKITQISGNFHIFVKIPGYLKSYLNSIKLSKLTKFQAIASKDGGAYLYYTILPIILIVIITKNV